LPPLVISRDLLTEALDVIDEAFAAPVPGPAEMPPATPA
jgi:hypothetical protein